MPEAITTILLVDDNPSSQHISKAMINALGFHVLIAANGRQALQLLQDHPVNLILMDCQMPVMDGLEATRNIRAMEDTLKNSVPVVAMTADVQQSTRAECITCGMDDFLTKPFTIAELKTLLVQHLGAG